MYQPSELLEPIDDILPHLSKWWRAAVDRYNAKFNLGEQLELGPSHGSLFIQKAVLSEMRKDPAVSGPYRPADRQQLEFLQYAGEDADVAIFFKKLGRWKGKLRSSGWLTAQQVERRSRGFMLNGRPLIPVVCGWVEAIEDGLVAIDQVMIGTEVVGGFEWAQALWTRARGDVVERPADQLPLIQPPIVKIRRSDSAQKADGPKIGIEQKRIQEQREREAKEKREQDERNSGPSGKGA